MMRLRHTVFATGTALLLAISAPTIADGVQKAAQQVFITNGDDKPVPTKAVGTTAVTGDVAVPGGVTVNGTPTVRLADGTTVATTAAAPERFQARLAAQNAQAGGEVCAAIEVPTGRRLVLDTVLFEAQRTDGAPDSVPNAYLRVRTGSEGGGVFDRFAPAYDGRASSASTGRLEAPITLDETRTTGAVCAGLSSQTDAIVTGTLEPLP